LQIVGFPWQEDFQKEVSNRGGEFRDTVYCFGEEEGESYTLCRWLRARKFDLAETIKMVEEATVVRNEPKQSNFYPGRYIFNNFPFLQLSPFLISYLNVIFLMYSFFRVKSRLLTNQTGE
jgi:hypothetical protein